jgi:hypothetical protein
MTETRQYTINENTRITVIFTPEETKSSVNKIYTAVCTSNFLQPSEGCNRFDVLLPEGTYTDAQICAEIKQIPCQDAPSLITITVASYPPIAQPRFLSNGQSTISGVKGTTTEAITDVPTGWIFEGWSFNQPLVNTVSSITGFRTRTGNLDNPLQVTLSEPITIWANFRAEETLQTTYTATCTPNRASPWLECEQKEITAEPGLNLSPAEICSQYNMIPCEQAPPTEENKWRSCVDGVERTGSPPPGYVATQYTGVGGGVCYYPPTQVGFIPSLETALEFTYTRNSFNFPSARQITAENPSLVKSYRVTFRTDENIVVTPSTFVLSPNGTQVFTVDVTKTFYDRLNDGTYDFDLRVEVTEL